MAGALRSGKESSYSSPTASLKEEKSRLERHGGLPLDLCIHAVVESPRVLLCMNASDVDSPVVVVDMSTLAFTRLAPLLDRTQARSPSSATSSPVASVRPKSERRARMQSTTTTTAPPAKPDDIFCISVVEFQVASTSLCCVLSQESGDLRSLSALDCGCVVVEPLAADALIRICAEMKSEKKNGEEEDADRQVEDDEDEDEEDGDFDTYLMVDCEIERVNISVDRKRYDMIYNMIRFM